MKIAIQMPMRHIHNRLALLCTSLAFCSGTWATLNVSPLMVEIPLARSNSTNITVLNSSSDRTIRAAIDIYEQIQDEEGNYRAVKTDLIKAFPPVLPLPPGATRRLRLFVPPNAAAKAAKTYFKIVARQVQTGEEVTRQRPDDAPQRSVAISILPAFHVPVYVYPKRPNFGVDISKFSVVGDKITTWLKNTGNSTIRMRALRPEIRIGTRWKKAIDVDPPVTKALVYNSEIRMEWACPNCKGQNVADVRLRGDAPIWGKFFANTTKDTKRVSK